MAGVFAGVLAVRHELMRFASLPPSRLDVVLVQGGWRCQSAFVLNGCVGLLMLRRPLQEFVSGVMPTRVGTPPDPLSLAHARTTY